MRYSLGWLSLLVSLLAAGLLLALLRQPAAAGATFTVNSTADATDANPGDGLCETAAGNGVCTLRAAVQETNALPGTDTIILPAGIYTITIPGDDFNAAAGDLDITDSLNLFGDGPGDTVVDGGGIDRVFDVRMPPGNTVVISGVTIRGGETAFGGGGVCHCTAGSVFILSDSHVISNTAFAGGGGGLLTYGQTTIMNSVIVGNSSSGGGGILASNSFGGAMTTIISTTVANNVLPKTMGLGAGIANSGVMTVTHSAIYSNTAVSGGKGSGGGGIANGSSGVLTVINSTLYQNYATSGSAVRNYGNATVFVTNTTIYSNTAVGVGAVSNTSTADVTLRNTILAQNSGGNCNVVVYSAGHNLDSGNSCGLNATGDLTNTVPLLGPLQDNGGPTWTSALLEGSPAIDAADNDGCPPTDQRGAPRPVDGGSGDPICDIGAYEYSAIPPGPTPTPTLTQSPTPTLTPTPTSTPPPTATPSELFNFLPAIIVEVTAAP